MSLEGDVSEPAGRLVALAESLCRCGRSNSVNNPILPAPVHPASIQGCASMSRENTEMKDSGPLCPSTISVKEPILSWNKMFLPPKKQTKSKTCAHITLTWSRDPIARLDNVSHKPLWGAQSCDLSDKHNGKLPCDLYRGSSISMVFQFTAA